MFKIKNKPLWTYLQYNLKQDLIYEYSLIEQKLINKFNPFFDKSLKLFKLENNIKNKKKIYWIIFLIFSIFIFSIISLFFIKLPTIIKWVWEQIWIIKENEVWEVNENLFKDNIQYWVDIFGTWEKYIPPKYEIIDLVSNHDRNDLMFNSMILNNYITSKIGWYYIDDKELKDLLFKYNEEIFWKISEQKLNDKILNDIYFNNIEQRWVVFVDNSTKILKRVILNDFMYIYWNISLPFDIINDKIISISYIKLRNWQSIWLYSIDKDNNIYISNIYKNILQTYWKDILKFNNKQKEYINIWVKNNINKYINNVYIIKNNWWIYEVNKDSFLWSLYENNRFCVNKDVYTLFNKLKNNILVNNSVKIEKKKDYSCEEIVYWHSILSLINFLNKK